MQCMEAVNDLDLPANPLDRPLNKLRLRGLDKVAELTGRKIWQIQRFNDLKGRMIVVYESVRELDALIRSTSKSGTASSKGRSSAKLPSLNPPSVRQASCKYATRVHITLELPLSADKTIQQLGPTHRSNQVWGPRGKILSKAASIESAFSQASELQICNNVSTSLWNRH